MEDLTSDAPTTRLYISMPASAKANDAAVIDVAKTESTEYQIISTYLKQKARQSTKVCKPVKIII